MSGKGVARQSDGCKICGKRLERRPGEKRQHFEARTYCSRECYRADPEKITPLADTKLCPVCQKAFRRRPGVSQSDWAKVRCCSRACVSRLPTPRHAVSKTVQAAKDLSWRIAMEQRRIQRIAKPPRTTFETIDEAVERGVPITRCPPAWTAPSDHLPNGSPVRQATGRRRSAS